MKKPLPLYLPGLRGCYAEVVRKGDKKKGTADGRR